MFESFLILLLKVALTHPPSTPLPDCSASEDSCVIEYDGDDARWWIHQEDEREWYPVSQ